MYTIDVEIEGVAPILFNGWSAEALRKLEVKETGGKLTPEERHQEACEKLRWRAPSGQFEIPAVPTEGTIRLSGILPPSGAFKKALIFGCSRANLKEGKTSLGTYLDATLFPDVDAEFRESDVFMHSHWGRRPARTGMACIVRRPALVAGWRLPIHMVVTDDNREPDRIREAVDAAGLMVGIGSWRPEYGRFIVREWKVTKKGTK